MPDTKIKLLIVDDEAATRVLLSKIFGQMGHRVEIAEDGFSALACMREMTPDILISDLNMPGMSGFELLSVVRRRLPAIYVIATSGAYAGKEVPYGIAADAFYEKASGFHSLLELMEIAAQTRVAVRGPEAAPLWISRTSDEPPGETYVMISCPECMRAFPGGFAESKTFINKTECIFCHTTIRYAIVQPLDPLTSQPYVPKPMASRMPAGRIDFGHDGQDENDERTCA